MKWMTLTTLLLLTVCSPAYAQSACFPTYKEMEDKLITDYKERRMWAGLNMEGHLMSVFVSQDHQTWTIIRTFPTGRTCSVDDGDMWLPYAPAYGKDH